MSGVALPNCNGVWAERTDPDEVLVAALLSHVAEAGLPYCLQLRPGAGLALTDLPVARGMVPGGPVPLMVLEGSGTLEAAQQVGGLGIRELAPEAVHEHVTIGAIGFGAPEELFASTGDISTAELAGGALLCRRGRWRAGHHWDRVTLYPLVGDLQHRHTAALPRSRVHRRGDRPSGCRWPRWRRRVGLAAVQPGWIPRLHSAGLQDRRTLELLGLGELTTSI